MVLKLATTSRVVRPEFESDVISDGTQTANNISTAKSSFESDVISDGTQTE